MQKKIKENNNALRWEIEQNLQGVREEMEESISTVRGEIIASSVQNRETLDRLKSTLESCVDENVGNVRALENKIVELTSRIEVVNTRVSAPELNIRTGLRDSDERSEQVATWVSESIQRIGEPGPSNESCDGNCWAPHATGTSSYVPKFGHVWQDFMM